MTSTFKRLYQGTPAQLAAPPLSTLTTSTTGGTGGLSASTQYNYAVSTVDSTGNETTPSAELAVSTGAGTTNSTTLTWIAVTGAASYRVYRRATTSGAGLQLVATIAAGTTTYTDPGTATSATSPVTVNGTGEATLYTTPAAAVVLVKQIHIANNNQQSTTAAISIVPSGGTGGAGNRIIPQLTEIRASSVRTFDLNQVLGAGDFLSGIVSTSGVVVTISGLVQS